MRRLDISSIWYFYKCYNICLAVTGIEDKLEKKKAVSWRRYINAVIQKNAYGKAKYLQELKTYISKDMIIINNAMKILAEERQTDPINQNNLWKGGIVGIPAYEID